VLGIMQNGRQVAADRYSYLACLGWALLAGAALAWVMNCQPRRSWLAASGVAKLAVLITLAVLTVEQIKVWHDTASLWTYMVEKDPRSSSAQNGYGDVLLKQGNIDESIKRFERSIELANGNDMAHVNLWKAWTLKENPNALLAALTRSASSPWDKVRASAVTRLVDVGEALLVKKDFAHAAEAYRVLLQFQPDSLEARTNLGLCLDKLGHRDQAQVEYLEVVRRNPNFFHARYNYGILLRSMNRKAEAVEQLRIATQLRPEHAGARTALEQLTGSQ
jgi:protein O-mannosyl-transferase